MVSETGAEIKRRRRTILAALLAEKESRNVVTEADHLIVASGLLVTVTLTAPPTGFLRRKLGHVAWTRGPFSRIGALPIAATAGSRFFAVARVPPTAFFFAVLGIVSLCAF